jgi:hypothetical protein
MSEMERCKSCELAIYCYSDSTTWVFRTKEEMEAKQTAMEECPEHAKIGARSEAAAKGA